MLDDWSLSGLMLQRDRCVANEAWRGELGVRFVLDPTLLPVKHRKPGFLGSRAPRADRTEHRVVSTRQSLRTDFQEFLNNESRGMAGSFPLQGRNTKYRATHPW